jgi:hypothetical protein
MPPPIGVVIGDRLLGEPLAGFVEGLLPGQDLLPFDLLAVLLRRRVHDELRGGPDVDPDAVTLDVGDDRIVRYAQDAIGVDSDFFSHTRHPTTISEGAFRVKMP